MKKDKTFSISKLSEITKMDRRTIARLLKSVPFEGGSASRPEWTLKCLESAGQNAVRANKGSSALKDQKLTEEIRKLRHLNDSNAALIVRRQAVCDAFGRIAQRVNKEKVEIETKWAARLVGLPDVPAARAELRRLVDNFFAILGTCREEWVRLETEEAAMDDEPDGSVASE